MKIKLFSKVYYLLLLPTFYVIHQFKEFYPAIPYAETLHMFIMLFITTVGVYVPVFCIYKRVDKAAILTFVLISVYLFYGATHDFFKNSFGDVFFLKYKILIPSLFLLLFLLGVYLFRVQVINKKIHNFLNLSFTLFILIDLFSLAFGIFNQKDKVSVAPIENLSCLRCDKPDIYLIITDEYAGFKELKEVFNFDNSHFIGQLKARGFHYINDSKSNYNATIFSIASMFNLNYLNLNNDSITLQKILNCGTLLNQNALVMILKNNGYTFYNHSFFDVSYQKKQIRHLYFPIFEELFTSQMLLKRIKRDVGYHFMSKEKIELAAKRNIINDSLIENLTINTITQKSPKFVYTHFTMPHHPYFKNSDTNNQYYDKMTFAPQQDKNSYLSYLQFANKKLLNLIDHILTKSTKQPVVILMSDHGWQQFEKITDKNYHFMNLNAIYLPEKNYRHFYDGMSNVNQFRALINTIFHKDLPMLKDSTSYLIEAKDNIH